jgi:hypothetical protein
MRIPEEARSFESGVRAGCPLVTVEAARARAASTDPQPAAGPT